MRAEWSSASKVTAKSRSSLMARADSLFIEFDSLFGVQDVPDPFEQGISLKPRIESAVLARQSCSDNTQIGTNPCIFPAYQGICPPEISSLETPSSGGESLRTDTHTKSSRENGKSLSEDHRSETRDQKSESCDTTDPPRLQDLDTRDQSSKWQKQAAVTSER